MSQISRRLYTTSATKCYWYMYLSIAEYGYTDIYTVTIYYNYECFVGDSKINFMFGCSIN